MPSRQRFTRFLIPLVMLTGMLLCTKSQAKTPLYYCNDPNWIPIDYIDTTGQPRGIAVDMLNHLFQKYLTEYRLLHWKTNSWQASLNAFRRKKCIILAEAVATPKRRQYMLFTQPILEYPLVFITRRNYPMLRGLQDIGQGVVARQRGSALISILKKRLPDIHILEVPDTASAYLSVAAGKADIAIAIPPVAKAMISRLALDNLIINGETGLTYPIRIAIHKAYPSLRQQLDAAITRMPLADRGRIQSFYTGDGITDVTSSPKNNALPEETTWTARLKTLVTAHTSIIISTLSLIALLLILLLWRQRKRVHQREVDALTGLPNRHRFNELAPKLIRKSGDKYPLSLIAVDIDHFKQVNDQYGHPSGDRVLIEIARILSELKRQQDVLVRWGGEEFLWLCPNTTFKTACALAEQAREQVQIRFHQHQNYPPLTISLGVACRGADETLEELIRRADKALYRAKHLGRNRVSCAKDASTAR